MKRLLAWPLLAILLLPLTANSALPPLDEDERVSLAHAIVEGVVYGVETTEVDDGRGNVDVHYRVTLRVDNVVKGQGVEPGQDVEIFYWRMKSRPEGWAGPSGQSDNIGLFTTIRAYLSFDDEEGRFELLEPNGFYEEEFIRL